MVMERRDSRYKRANRFELKPEICTDGSFKGYLKLDWIHSAAKKDQGKRFDNLLHHLNEDNFRQAFRQLSGNKAVGIDQVTKSMYGKNLNSNLEALANEVGRGGWRPKPTRVVEVPKLSGGTRSIEIGCFEDKLVQQVVAKILEAIYEPVFYRHSYGFRPGRNTHQALARLYTEIEYRSDKVCVVEIDIQKFFDQVDHEKLIEILSERIGDQHLIRIIRRILRNSNLKPEGRYEQKLSGTPQGSPLSLMLANIYLHAILDQWFLKNFESEGVLIRYADDLVAVFSSPERAEVFLNEIKTQLWDTGKLRINEEKSKLIHFSKSEPQGCVPFVGFELYWGRANVKSREKVLKVKTAKIRTIKAIQTFKEWIKANRNRHNLTELWRQVEAKLRGHYQYFGVSFNRAKLYLIYHNYVGLLFRWLNRRSQKRSFTWDEFSRKLHFNPLPMPPPSNLLVNITNSLGTVAKRKPRSRMRKLRTYGSNRSFGGQPPLFT